MKSYLLIIQTLTVYLVTKKGGFLLLRQLTFNLLDDASRPIIDLDGCPILLDTGAELPVCTVSYSVFKTIFPDAQKIKDNAELKGFGSAVTCPMYKCFFKLKDLLYPELPILLHPMEHPGYSIILSASMFYGLIYEVDAVNYKLNITVPDNQSLIRNLHIKDSQGNMHVLTNEHIITPEATIWRDYCARYNVQDEEAEMIRLQGIYKTRDNAEVLENIRHDYL